MNQHDSSKKKGKGKRMRPRDRAARWKRRLTQPPQIHLTAEQIDTLTRLFNRSNEGKLELLVTEIDSYYSRFMESYSCDRQVRDMREGSPSAFKKYVDAIDNLLKITDEIDDVSREMIQTELYGSAFERWDPEDGYPANDAPYVELTKRIVQDLTTLRAPILVLRDPMGERIPPANEIHTAAQKSDTDPTKPDKPQRKSTGRPPLPDHAITFGGDLATLLANNGVTVDHSPKGIFALALAKLFEFAGLHFRDLRINSSKELIDKSLAYAKEQRLRPRFERNQFGDSE